MDDDRLARLSNLPDKTFVKRKSRDLLFLLPDDAEDGMREEIVPFRYDHHLKQVEPEVG